MTLNHTTPSIAGEDLRLREITGFIEHSVEGATTDEALKMLGSLLNGTGTGEHAKSKAASLTVPERDRLLGQVLINTFGELITSTVDCLHCEQPFDIDFSLKKLVADLNKDLETEIAGNGTPVETLPDGTFRLPDGRRFRHPTGVDEQALSNLPQLEAVQHLLNRCQVEGPPIDGNEEAGAVVQEAMAATAPILKKDLAAVCPECATHQTFNFDVQYYLLRALIGERGRLTREIHCLASAYGWSLSEILGLPRSQRRRLVELVSSETF